MPNRHLLIGLIAIVIIATAGGVSYAALGTKPETAQVQQTPAPTSTGSAAGTTNPVATAGTPAATSNASAPAATQATPGTTGSSTKTSGGGSTTPSPAPKPSPTPTPSPTPSPTPTPSPSPTPSPTPTPTPPPPPPPPTYTYKNGSFSKTVAYSTPGGPESLGVTITVTNDIVSNSSITISSTSGESGFYQTQFQSNYQPSVVGKALATLNLSRVAGASLTTNAFNSALTTIRTLAKN